LGSLWFFLWPNCKCSQKSEKKQTMNNKKARTKGRKKRAEKKANSGENKEC